MKVVAISDLHLDARLHGRRRFEEVARALDRSIAKALDVDADLWIFGGDLCDPDAGPIVFPCVQALVKAVTEGAPFRKLIVAGNHDVIEDGSGATVLSPLVPLEDLDLDLTVANAPVSFPWGGTHRVHALPFTATSHAYDPEKFVAEIEDDAGSALRPGVIHLFVSHLSVGGILPGEETTEMARGRTTLLPRELIGKRFGKRAVILQSHYHRRQLFNPGDGYPAVQVIGAPARFTFGEETHDPGFLVLDI